MSQVIDVSGLPEAVVNDLKRLVETLRGQAAPVSEQPSRRSGPPPDETPEQWVARFRAWAESHEKRDIQFDDSRESIYEGRGE